MKKNILLYMQVSFNIIISLKTVLLTASLVLFQTPFAVGVVFSEQVEYTVLQLIKTMTAEV